MKPMAGNYKHREQIIAALLWYGTWFASTIIAVGMILGGFDDTHSRRIFGLSGYDFVKGGVAFFILLPVARVALMMSIFLRERDYAYTIISILVLAIIGVGILISV